MNISSFLVLLFVIGFNCPNCVGNNSNQDQTNNLSNKTHIYIDTSYVILSFDNVGMWCFDSTYKPSTLDEDDLALIEKLSIISVNDHNNTTKNPFSKIEAPLSSYKKQYVAVMNKEGEREVWINCFHTFMEWALNRWKKEIVGVHDGGNAFFNFKINLSKKQYYNFKTNGFA